MVRIGEKIDISLDGKTIRCRIEKMSNDGGLLSIVEEANTLRIEKPFSMSITRPNGVETAEGIVLKVRPPVIDDADNKKAYANKLEYLIKITSPFKRVQKRNAVRHECYIQADLSELGGDTLYDGHILDISSGGMKVHTNHRFISNKAISISTTLGDTPATYFGVILGIDEVNLREYKYAMRIRFIEMSRSDGDVIAKFIFTEYRKSAQKRMNKDNV